MMFHYLENPAQTVHIWTVPLLLNQFRCKQVKSRRGLGFEASATAYAQ